MEFDIDWDLARELMDSKFDENLRQKLIDHAEDGKTLDWHSLKIAFVRDVKTGTLKSAQYIQRSGNGNLEVLPTANRFLLQTGYVLSLDALSPQRRRPQDLVIHISRSAIRKAFWESELGPAPIYLSTEVQRTWQELNNAWQAYLETTPASVERLELQCSLAESHWSKLNMHWFNAEGEATPIKSEDFEPVAYDDPIRMLADTPEERARPGNFAQERLVQLRAALAESEPDQAPNHFQMTVWRDGRHDMKMLHDAELAKAAKENADAIYESVKALLNDESNYVIDEEDH